jgi:hypothetical protein
MSFTKLNLKLNYYKRCISLVVFSYFVRRFYFVLFRSSFLFCLFYFARRFYFVCFILFVVFIETSLAVSQTPPSG